MTPGHERPSWEAEDEAANAACVGHLAFPPRRQDSRHVISLSHEAHVVSLYKVLFPAAFYLANFSETKGILSIYLYTRSV